MRDADVDLDADADADADADLEVDAFAEVDLEVDLEVDASAVGLSGAKLNTLPNLPTTPTTPITPTTPTHTPSLTTTTTPGPFREDQLKSMWDEKRIHNLTKVWWEEMEDWQQIDTLPALKRRLWDYPDAPKPREPKEGPSVHEQVRCDT